VNRLATMVGLVLITAFLSRSRIARARARSRRRDRHAKAG
jgi:hypothetical protein